MERIDLSTYVPKSPQQKQLVEYEKLLQQSEKDFESLQNQFEELEQELKDGREDCKRKDLTINKSVLEKRELISIIETTSLHLHDYLDSKWIKSTKLQSILKNIQLWKTSKNNS